MWKHKNFINLQLCAGEQDELAGTWVFNENPDVSGSGTIDVNINFTSNQLNFTNMLIIKGSIPSGTIQYGEHEVYSIMIGWDNEAYKTITIASKLSEVTNGDALLTWLKANGTKQSTPQPTLTFKHFFDAGTIGSGTVKFRHYSQQEPSSGDTWVLNESGLENHTLSKQSVAFTSNGKSYIAIENFSSGSGLFYYKTENDYDAPYVDGGPEGFIWTNQAYRTLVFATPPTGDLLTWLQANGTKQGGGASNT